LCQNFNLAFTCTFFQNVFWAQKFLHENVPTKRQLSDSPKFSGPVPSAMTPLQLLSQLIIEISNATEVKQALKLAQFPKILQNKSFYDFAVRN